MSGCNIGLDVKRGYTSWNLRRSYEFYDVIASRIHSNGVGSFIAFKAKAQSNWYSIAACNSA